MSATHVLARRQAMVDGLTAAIDGGTGTAAAIRFYDGSPPPVDNAIGGTNHLLATVTLNTPPSFGAANSSAVAAANGVPLSAAVAIAGTPTFYRIVNLAGNVIQQGTVGTSGADFIFANTTWSVGGSVSVTSYTITGPS